MDGREDSLPSAALNRFHIILLVISCICFFTVYISAWTFVFYNIETRYLGKTRGGGLYSLQFFFLIVLVIGLAYLSWNNDLLNLSFPFSSEDEVDVLLHGTPEQKRKLIRECLTGESESSSEDEFQKEMEAELDCTMKSIAGKWKSQLASK